MQTASGEDKNQMSLKHFDVRAFAGKTARLEILDDATGGWGNVGVGKIVFTDQPTDAGPLEKLPDFGTMALALLGEAADQASADATAPFTEKLSGSLGRKLKLAPGESATVTFVVAVAFSQSLPGRPVAEGGTLLRHQVSFRARRRAVCRGTFRPAGRRDPVVARHLV